MHQKKLLNDLERLNSRTRMSQIRSTQMQMVMMDGESSLATITKRRKVLRQTPTLMLVQRNLKIVTLQKALLSMACLWPTRMQTLRAFPMRIWR